MSCLISISADTRRDCHVKCYKGMLKCIALDASSLFRSFNSVAIYSIFLKNFFLWPSLPTTPCQDLLSNLIIDARAMFFRISTRILHLRIKQFSRLSSPMCYCKLVNIKSISGWHFVTQAFIRASSTFSKWTIYQFQLQIFSFFCTRALFMCKFE